MLKFFHFCSFLLYIVFGGLFLDVYIHVGLCLLEELTTLLLQNISFIFDNNHCLDTNFICYKYSQSSFHDYFSTVYFPVSAFNFKFLFLSGVSCRYYYLLGLSSLVTFAFYFEYLTISFNLNILFYSWFSICASWSLFFHLIFSYPLWDLLEIFYISLYSPLLAY